MQVTYPGPDPLEESTVQWCLDLIVLLQPTIQVTEPSDEILFYARLFRLVP